MESGAIVLYAPIFMGFIFNILLYGVTFVQMYAYYTTYKKDRLWLKIFVWSVFLCDSLQTAFDTAYIFDRLLSQYGSSEALALSSWQYVTHIVSFTIMASMVQLFFAWKLKILGSWIIVAVIVLCSMAQFAGGLGTGIGVSFLTELSEYKLHNVEVTAAIWLVFAAFTDIVIAVVFVLYLRKQRTGLWIGTDDVIKRIIRLTVQTGTATALFAFVDVVIYLSLPTTSSVHIFFCFVTPKLYANSVMMSLNARDSYQKTLANIGNFTSTTSDPSSIEFRAPAKTLSANAHSTSVPEMSSGVIEIDVEKARPVAEV